MGEYFSREGREGVGEEREGGGCFLTTSSLLRAESMSSASFSFSSVPGICMGRRGPVRGDKQEN